MLSVDQEDHNTTPSPGPIYPPCLPASLRFSPSLVPPLPASEVDLPTPAPNFSIRDYVLTSRSKDIKNNWPFSLKSLQLCLKHGLKDVLPPFHTLEELRDLSFETCTVGTCSSEKHRTSLSEEEASGPVFGDNVILDTDVSHDAPLNKKFAKSCLDVSSCRAEVKDFPATITSVTQSELGSIVPVKRQSRSVPSKRKTSLKVSCELEAAGPSPAQKTESTSRPLGRKCRLVVKLGVQSGRSPTEDISSNCALNTATETMASKVCPVCKIFCSSSNTTLNAHIDQCLSTESTSLWTAGSKVARRRIKPRKIKLMVDIYASAQKCTLEDLDRRNGTNWSLIASSPTRETEKAGAIVQRKKLSMLPVHQENASGVVGPVYIDANGTKVGILSKLNSPTPPASDAGNDSVGRGPFIGTKCSSKKKKKRIMQKHQKYLKLVPRSRKDFSHKVQGSQMGGGHKIFVNEQMDGEDVHQVSMGVQSADSGTFKPWLCSRRRDFAKKIKSPATCQTVSCKWHLPRHLLVDKEQLLPGGSVENHGHEITNFHGNAMKSSEICRRKEIRFRNAQVYGEEGYGRKRVGSSLPLVATKMGKKGETLFVQMKHGADQLNKERISMKGGHLLEPPFSAQNRKSSPGKKFDGIQKEAKPTRSSQAIITKARRFSSFRKNILSYGNRCPNTISGHSKPKKAASLSKSLFHAFARKDDQMEQYHVIDHEPSFGEDLYKDNSELENGGAEPSLRRVDFMKDDEENETLPASQRDHIQDRRTSRSNCHHVQTSDEYLLLGPSSMAVDGFLPPEAYLPGRCAKVQSAEIYKGFSSESETLNIAAEPKFDDDQHMFCVDEIASNVVGHNTDLSVAIESETCRENSFPEVDPIPIPGPPGSYLPSPRGMSSEDFQGNSSLTTSQVHTSVDLPEVVDRDSSDSPISIASTISNSNSDRDKFDLKYLDRMAGVTPIAFQGRNRPGSAAACTGPLMQNGGPVPQVTCPVMDKPSCNGRYSRLYSFTIDDGSLSHGCDQPCCCKRKKRFTRDVCLNHEESQLLRRRRLSSLTFPATEREVGHNAIASHSKLDGRPEFFHRATSESENLARPMLGSSSLSNGSPGLGARLLARADCDSASPASNPILRLMGKNLMVASKDEKPCVAHESVQTTPLTNHSISLNAHLSCQFPSGPAVPPPYDLDQNARGFQHIVSGRPITFNEGHHVINNFDAGFSASSRTPYDLRSTQEEVPSPAYVCLDQHKDYAFGTSLGLFEHKGDLSVPGLQNNESSKQSVSATDIPLPDQQSKYAGACNHPVKEIITIDDSSGSDEVKFAEGWRETPQVVSYVISMSTTPSYNPSRVYPISYFQPPQNHHLHSESAAVQHANFPMATRLTDPSTVCWGSIPEGVGAEQKNSVPPRHPPPKA